MAPSIPLLINLTITFFFDYSGKRASWLLKTWEFWSQKSKQQPLAGIGESFIIIIFFLKCDLIFQEENRGNKENHLLFWYYKRLKEISE